MTETTAERLRRRNLRDLWLIEENGQVHEVPPGTLDADHFVLARIEARDIRANLLFAALGRDGYVEYATWYQAQAQQALATAQAHTRKPNDPEPFDDTPPDDSRWRAHSIALEQAAEDAILELGLVEPRYEEVADALGPYRAHLVRALVHWTRPPPPDAADRAPEAGGPGNSPSGSSAPP